MHDISVSTSRYVFEGANKLEKTVVIGLMENRAPMGNADHWQRGAVLVPIFTRAPRSVVFVERGWHLRRHPGQIGFPGGTADPIDAGDPVRTALRELGEELGVGAEHVCIVGRLPDLEQVLNRLVITPIIGLVDSNAHMTADGEEIVGLFSVPLTLIVANGAIYEDAELSSSRGRPMYAFDFEERHIWGFTAAILRSFVDAWNEPESALRAAVLQKPTKLADPHAAG